MPTSDREYRDQLKRRITALEGGAKKVEDPTEARERADRIVFGGITPDPFNIAQPDAGKAITMSVADAALEQTRLEAGDKYADQFDKRDVASWLAAAKDTPQAFAKATLELREAYAETRFDVSVNIAQGIGDLTDGKSDNPFLNILQSVMGSNEAAGFVGTIEALGRPQQALYGLLSGEGEAAFQRLVPKVIIHDPSDGGEISTSPIEEVWDALWDFNGDNYEHHMDKIQQANREYASTNVLEMQDVMDAWDGEETMDELYYSMSQRGIIGKIEMANMAVGQALGEIFVDPLIVFDGIGVAMTKGARAVGTTVQKAASAAKYARKTDRLVDLQDAASAAKRHLRAAKEQHEIERSVESLKRVDQAERNMAERVDAVLAQRRADDGGFDRVYMGPERGSPHVINTRETMDIPFQITPESATRGNVVRRARRVVSDLDDHIKLLEDDLTQLKSAGSPATSEQVGRMTKEIRKLEKAKQRAIVDPDNIPDIIEFESTFLRTRTADEIREIRDYDRMAAAWRSSEFYQPRPASVMEGSLADDPQIARRVAGGADDAEYASENLARLADGADPEDLYMPSALVPEYSAATAGQQILNVNDGLIDLRAVSKRLEALKAQATKGQGKVYDKAIRDAKKAIKDGEAVPFDENWLPAARKNIEDEMFDSWKRGYVGEFRDKVAQAFNPGAWRVPMSANMRRNLMFAREPMRVMGEMDPKGWQALRNSTRNMEAEYARLSSSFDDSLQKLGGLKVVEPSGVRKGLQTDPPVRRYTNPERMEEIADMLEVPRGTKEWDDMLDGMTDEEVGALLNIRKEFDEYADKFGLTGTDKFVEGYMPHGFDPQWYKNGRMPPDQKGMARNGHVFAGFLMKRTGQEGYIKDAGAMLDLYARGVTRKMYLEPALDTIKKTAMDLSKQRGNAWYAAYTYDMLAQYKGEPSRFGKMLDSTANALSVSTGKEYRPGTWSRRLMAVPAFTYAAVLGANRRYPVMAVATALATTSARYGMFRTMKGMFMSATPEGQLIFKGAQGEKMWNQIFEGADKLDGFMREYTAAASGARLLTPSIQDSENFIRGMTFWASIDESLTKMGFSTLEDASKARFEAKILADAMRSSEEVNHFFGIGAKPPILSRVSKSGSAAATQFLSFGPKQTETLAQLMGENPGFLGRYLMISGWMTRVAAQDMGLDLSDYLGMGYARTAGTRDMTTPAVELLWNTVKMTGTLADFVKGSSTHEDMQKVTDNWIKSIEAVVPALNAMRSIAKSSEAIETGQQIVPGQGRPRPVDMTLTGQGKGERGELTAILTGLRSEKERRAQEARGEIRRLESEVKLGRKAAAEHAFRAMKDGDTSEFNKQVARLVKMGVPLGDVSNSVALRKQVEILHWHYQEMAENPALAHKKYEILERNKIIGGGDE